MGIACRDVACRVRVGCVLQVACGRTAVVETHGRASLLCCKPRKNRKKFLLKFISR